MVAIQELRQKFSVKNVEPYGKVIVVPSHHFEREWESSLESEGHRVFLNSYNGELAFFIRLNKSKPKSVPSIDHKPTLPRRLSLGFPNYPRDHVKVTKNQGGEGKEMSSENQYKLIPIDLIASSAKPSRETFEDIDCLAETIKRHGLIEPIIVRAKGKEYGWEVIVGERRLRACRKAGLEKIPCIEVPGVDEEQIILMQLVENIHRLDLKVFEEVRLVETLKNRGLSHEEVAIKTGLSHGTVENYLTIARLPEEYLRIIGRDRHDPTALTITKALLLAQAQLPADKLKETVELIKREGLTRQALAKKLATETKSKIKRVRQSKVYWKDLTKSVREYAGYWSDFCELKEWESVSHYYLQLNLCLPKDLQG